MDREEYSQISITSAPAPPSTAAALSDRALVLRFVGGLLVLLGVSALASHFFGTEFKALSETFLASFGVAGCAVGTWLADGFTFPIPPQVYMAMAKDIPSMMRIFPVIVAGSMLGGVTGYLLSPYLARFHIVAETVRRSEAKVRALCGDGWVRGVVVVSLSPVAFSWLCYAAGLYRIPRASFALLCLLRIPKLVLYQALIWYTWK